jgi:FKBP12-rapamycin complex-associated protein
MWKPIYPFNPFAQVTGIEGTYRRTCESVMSVLHRNKDSLMAVLEAFVYDPLLNWRLMDSAAPKAKRSKAQTDSSISSSSQEHGDILDSGGSLSATVPKKGAPSSVENGGEFYISCSLSASPPLLPYLKHFQLVHVIQ